MSDFVIRDHTDFLIEQLKNVKKAYLEHMTTAEAFDRDVADLYVDATYEISKAIEGIKQSGLRIATKRFNKSKKGDK